VISMVFPSMLIHRLAPGARNSLGRKGGREMLAKVANPSAQVGVGGGRTDTTGSRFVRKHKKFELPRGH
jgi:hypothetical protein